MPYIAIPFRLGTTGNEEENWKIHKDLTGKISISLRTNQYFFQFLYFISISVISQPCHCLDNRISLDLAKEALEITAILDDYDMTVRHL